MIFNKDIKNLPPFRLKKQAAWLLLFLTTLESLQAAEIVFQNALSVHGKIHLSENISAVGRIGGDLIVGSDEGNSLQILSAAHQPDTYQANKGLIALSKKPVEIDIEAMAVSPSYLYVIGSHSIKRKKIKDNISYKKNRERFSEIEKDPARNQLFRIKKENFQKGAFHTFESISLDKVFARDKFLSPFSNIPGKENGIDVEGLAVTEDEKLYVGFRSPVLRHNYVPVLVMSYNKPESYDLKFVNLKGRGIRSLEKVKEGFLILAGPSAGGAGSYEIYLWDGEDGIPNEGKSGSKLISLGEIPLKGEEAPEGMMVDAETSQSYDLILAFDNSKDGHLSRFRVKKP